MSTLTRTADRPGERADAFLARVVPDLTRSAAQRLLEAGAVRLAGRPVRKNYRTAPGDVLEVDIPAPQPVDLVPQDIPLDIVYEDGDLLVLNKAPGVLIHPGPGHYSDTLCNYIAWYYKKAGIAADVHPVQRLDKGTSGLLVVAKHPHAQEQLKGQLHTPAFRRIYLAVCEGIPRPPEGCIDAPIGRVPGSLMARQVDPAGQPASTRYRVLRTGQGRALVELELDTGRTHQIRVHMAHIGHPLTGDFLYGTEDHSLISRPALHSARLSLRHPVTGEPMAWEQPLPEDMARLV